MKIKTEREQKFRVLKADLSNLGIGTEIFQGYLCVKPPIRVRIENFRNSFLTTKIKTAPGVNLEFEEKIPLYIAHRLLTVSQYNPISKTRYKMGQLEIDIFYNILKGLVLLEWEQRFIEEKVEIPPDFLSVEEVTGDERFENHRLCQLDKLPEEWRCQIVPRSL